MKQTTYVWLLFMSILFSATLAAARPMGSFRGNRPPPPPPMRHHAPPPRVHHGSFWGPGGRHFLPGFVGGLVGSALYRPSYRPVVTSSFVVQPSVVVASQPVAVSTEPVATTPVYATQSVWVEGRYIDQVQANGTVVRVWQPGHYEQQQVLVQ